MAKAFLIMRDTDVAAWRITMREIKDGALIVNEVLNEKIREAAIAREHLIEVARLDLQNRPTL